MNLDKTAKTLKKINRLYELINDIGESTETERDLLKAYAKDLYNSLCTEEELIDDEISRDKASLKKEEKRIKKEHKAAAKEAKVENTEVVEVEEVVVEEAEVIVPEEKKVAQPAQAASSASDTRNQATTPSSTFSPDMLAIFEEKPITELSDKLSQTPISDLTKAMGINERIFTVNELFGGNTSEFNNLMVALNGLDNYGEARVVLMKSVASKYDWDAPAKQKKAKQLVQLIQRRFN